LTGFLQFFRRFPRINVGGDSTHLSSFGKRTREPRPRSVEDFEGIINHITTNNYIAFPEDEILVEGRGHNKALHVSVRCVDHVIAKVLIDNGSSLNVMPKTTL